MTVERLLDEAAGTVDPPRVHEIKARARRRQRRRTTAVGGLAVAALIGVTGFIATLSEPSTEVDVATEPPSSTSTAAPTPPPTDTTTTAPTELDNTLRVSREAPPRFETYDGDGDLIVASFAGVAESAPGRLVVNVGPNPLVGFGVVESEFEIQLVGMRIVNDGSAVPSVLTPNSVEVELENPVGDRAVIGPDGAQLRVFEEVVYFGPEADE